MEYKIKHLDQSRAIQVENHAYHMHDKPLSSVLNWIKKDEYASLHFDNKSYRIALVKMDLDNKTVKLRVNGRVMDFQIADPMDQLLTNLGFDKLMTKSVSEVKSPMPGLVLKVLCEAGQTVTKGEPLLVLEAMKMENVIKSPVDATIKSIEVTEKSAIDKNAVMIRFV
jgi:biotin carboxyl carrier protein